MVAAAVGAAVAKREGCYAVGMLLFGTVALALAAEPNRCVVSWSPPTSGCAIRTTIEAHGSGPNRKAAERAARKQLGVAIDATALSQMARLGTPVLGDFSSCKDDVATAYIDCFPDTTLSAPDALCFVTLDDVECWNGDVLHVETLGWKALEEGRKQMCAAVDARIVALNYTDMVPKQAICKAACEVKTVVRCPTGANP